MIEDHCWPLQIPRWMGLGQCQLGNLRLLSDCLPDMFLCVFGRALYVGESSVASSPDFV